MIGRDMKLKVVDILEDNARTTPEEIALMLDADADEIKKVIGELEEDKVIVKYSAIINRQNLAEDDLVEALIEVKITPQRDFGYDDLARRIYQYDEVRSVYLVAGSYDLSVRVQAKSMKEISKFVFEKLAVIDGVTSTVTVFIMRIYKAAGVVLVENQVDDRLVVSP